MTLPLEGELSFRAGIKTIQYLQMRFNFELKGNSFPSIHYKAPEENKPTSHEHQHSESNHQASTASKL